MSDQDAFERILASLYDAMLDDSCWPAVSALIVRALFVRLCRRGQRREDLERDYLENYHPIDERVPRFRQLP